MGKKFGRPRLPRLQQVVEFEGDFPLWNVVFYPYGKPGDDPVFAVVGQCEILVYRLTGGQDLERLYWLQEFAYEDNNLFAMCWSQKPVTGEPLLCVSGERFGIVKIIDVLSEVIYKLLNCHGQRVSSLQTSPIDPLVIASASDDNSIRIWHLLPGVEQQPCAAILAGDGGHETGVVSLAFHANGRYLLSGGYDTRICLWVLPDYLTSPDEPYSKAGGDAHIIHFPHFCTTAVHFHQIDALAFHGDHILSMSYNPETDSQEHNRILLWRIIGFNSNRPVPPPTAAPANMPRGIHTTVSAWSDTAQGSGGFQVLMAFECPGVKAEFMRFGLSPVFDLPETFDADPTLKTPSVILAIGTHPWDKPKDIPRRSKHKDPSTSTPDNRSSTHWRVPTSIHLWDLGLLADGITGRALTETVSAKGVGSRREKSIAAGHDKSSFATYSPFKSRPSLLLNSEVEPDSSAVADTSAVSARPDIDTTEVKIEKVVKKPKWGPYTPQQAHKVIQAGQNLKVPDFTPRTLAWSPDGAVAVVVGDSPPCMWILGWDS